MKQEVTKSPKICLCRVCGGSGRTAAEAPSDSPRVGENNTVVCPNCGGSGRVVVSARMYLDVRPYKPKE